MNPWDTLSHSALMGGEPTHHSKLETKEKAKCLHGKTHVKHISSWTMCL